MPPTTDQAQRRHPCCLGALALGLGLLLPIGAYPHPHPCTLNELLSWPLERLLQAQVSPGSQPGTRSAAPMPARQEVPR
ncbi:hypothetical protein [Sphaerotilus microaerophilus]|uniref:Uncharacterized protein n=1 Tax=Sphaerotilus microaerophilus TaxID=2914710 RepID=A0ABN6PIR6_9BURK|nr:hypothetical protein [Sphaerotilus sp. FB-5]BDI03904.1 hypothetical protein CATMQ487_08740 [Sphaerotilus sp. FB-5]